MTVLVGYRTPLFGLRRSAGNSSSNYGEVFDRAIGAVAVTLADGCTGGHGAAEVDRCGKVDQKQGYADAGANWRWWIGGQSCEEAEEARSDSRVWSRWAGLVRRAVSLRRRAGA
jgi:hypothetical protein